MTEIISEALLRKLRDSNYDAQFDHGLTPMHIKKLLEDAQEEFLRIEKLYLQVKDAISLYSSVLAPIRRVPTEILLSIFGYLACAPIEVDHSKRARRPIWAASQVCRRWRQVVRSNSILWSNVHVTNVYPEQVEYTKRELAVLHELSGSQPLHIHAHDSYLRIDSDGTVNVCPIFQAAYEQHSRWRTVDLWISYRELHHMFVRPIGLSSLVEWRLKVHHPSSDTSVVIPDPVVSISAEEAPQLRRVTIVDYSGPRTIVLPWSQLSYILVQGCPVEKGLYIISQLEHSQTIRHLELECTDGAEPISASPMDNVPSAIRLPSLEKLVFSLDALDETSVRDNLMQRILLRLYLPSLQALCLSSISAPLLHALVAMLDQSGCFIRSLYLYNSSLATGEDGSDTIEFMQTISSRIFSQLRKLKVKESRTPLCADSLLQALSNRDPQSNSFTLLPHLERLELDLTKFTPSTFVSMADARISARGRGRKFKALMKRSSILGVPTPEVSDQEQAEDPAQAIKDEFNRRLDSINESGDGEVHVDYNS